MKNETKDYLALASKNNNNEADLMEKDQTSIPHNHDHNLRTCIYGHKQINFEMCKFTLSTYPRGV